MLRPVVLLALSMLPAPVAAQVVRGTVTDAQSGQPVAGAVIWLTNEAGARVAERLATGEGGFTLGAPGPGIYRIHAERIGYETYTSELVRLADGETIDRTLATMPRAVSLVGLTVEAEQRCVVRPEAGEAAARLWDEASKVLTTAALGAEQDVFDFRLARWKRDLHPTTLAVESEERQTRSGASSNPLQSAPAAELQELGYIREMEDGGQQYFVPDARVLLSDEFLDGHCFVVEEGEDDEDGMIGLAFRPIPGRDLPDVRGVLWLDRETAHLRHLEVSFTNTPYRVPSGDLGARVEFEGLPNGAWIVRRWWLRMPRIALEEAWVSDRRVQNLRLIGVLEEGAEVGEVRLRGEVLTRGPQVARIRGTLVDSTTLSPENVPVPIEGATVYLNGTQYSGRTDVEGRFDLDGVPPGSYDLVFLHDRLAELAIYATSKPVVLEGGVLIEADVAIPSRRTIMNALCIDRGPNAAAIVGRVLDEEGRPVPDAEVQVDWSDYDLPPIGERDRGDHTEWIWGRRLELDSRGSFRVCAVPSLRPVRLRAVWSDREVVDSLRLRLDQLVDRTLTVRR